jgi:hypothetical protein
MELTIDHSKQILMWIDDGDKAIGVPFNLVKFPDGKTKTQCIV